MFGPYGGYMDDIFPLFFKKYQGKQKGVIHQETCPECGKTLANLYYRQDKWKCKKCWDNSPIIITMPKNHGRQASLNSIIAAEELAFEKMVENKEHSNEKV